MNDFAEIIKTGDVTAQRQALAVMAYKMFDYLQRYEWGRRHVDRQDEIVQDTVEYALARLNAYERKWGTVRYFLTVHIMAHLHQVMRSNPREESIWC